MQKSGNISEKAGTPDGYFVRGEPAPTCCMECGFRHGDVCYAVADGAVNVIDQNDLYNGRIEDFCPIEREEGHGDE